MELDFTTHGQNRSLSAIDYTLHTHQELRQLMPRRLSEFLSECRTLQGMSSLCASEEVLTYMVQAQQRLLTYVVVDNDIAAVAGIARHTEYQYIDLQKNPVSLRSASGIAELCSLYVRPAYRGLGLARLLTDLRLKALTTTAQRIIVEVRPDPSSTLDSPIAHPDAAYVEALALENQFAYVGLNPEDSSKVYLWTKRTS